jgi:hypothetical protein
VVFDVLDAVQEKSLPLTGKKFAKNNFEQFDGPSVCRPRNLKLQRPNEFIG